MYLQRYKAEINMLHLLSVQMRSQRISKRVITTERKESKVIEPCMEPQKTTDRNCRGMFKYSSVKRKLLYLAGKGADAAGARHTTPLGGFVPSVMSLGQRLGASQKLYPWKGEEWIKCHGFTVQRDNKKVHKGSATESHVVPTSCLLPFKVRLSSLGLREQL